MAFIVLGRLDKKQLLIVLKIVVQAARLIAKNEGKALYENNLVNLESDISSIIVGIILYFMFKNRQVKKDTPKKGKKRHIYVIFLFLFYAIRLTTTLFEHKKIVNTQNGITIMLMTLVTFFSLKYKYYIHHIITLIIFCVLGVGMDLILGSYLIIDGRSLIFCMITIIGEVMVYCYMKYMMDKLYYGYTEVILYYGISGLIAKLGFMLGLGIYEYKNKIDGNYGNIFNSLKTYFTTTNAAIIIFFQFITFLLIFGLENLLIILIIYYFRPNHMIINDEINSYLSIILYKNIENKEKNIKQTDKYYISIPFFFKILSLLFYFEILELNFCNLNKNTVKNIQAREKHEDDSNNESRDSVISNNIELVDQNYSIENESIFNDEEEIDNNDDKKINDDKAIN